MGRRLQDAHQLPFPVVRHGTQSRICNNVHSELHGVPMCLSARQDGIDSSENFATAMAAMGAPILAAGGYTDFDDFIAEAKEATPEAPGKSS